MRKPEDLYESPNALAPLYDRFRVCERLLLTGHSHQAWPDRGYEGQCLAWRDAAEYVDDKWERAFEKAERVGRGFSRMLGDTSGHVSLATSTHDLVIRFLSALPLKERPRLVTTDGEFHSMRRQLDRLAEEGIEIKKVPSRPADEIAGRLIRSLDDRTAAVLVSTVLFQNAHIVTGLGDVLAACRKKGAELLLDAYHTLNVVPISLRDEGLEEAFVVGGGYKYCQLGGGNSFLRFPEGCRMRPMITGWFSEFDTLSDKASKGRVSYGRGSWLFAGATYDPTSHYRAAEVFDFFEEQELSPEFLRQVSQHQVGLLVRLFDGLDADPGVIDRDRSVSLEGVGGFLALESSKAMDIQRKLHERGVFSDSRGPILRLGPAPYLSDGQLEEAMGVLGSVVRSL